MTELPAPIEFWFDFSSPYAYFAAATVDDLGAQTRRSVLWRPFLLGIAFRESGMRPLVETPLRGAYARHDWNRLARLTGLPFRIPEPHPFAATAVSRTYYWIEQTMPDRAQAFAKAAFRGYYGEGRDLTDVAVLVDLAGALAIPSKPLRGAIESDEMKDLLRQRTAEAVAKGIFGSPFFMADGEPFWGWDRMPLLRQWLDRGGW